ncbi:lipase family protein [Vibrio sp. IRLE0018]|uniref:lipase family protein n=1 Tax=Vibrio floridensis TaxID=2908007 RepID=UPI001F3393F4|nr:lipase family protein [Vibrio floridensis]MCF8777523.1 lipase family protein [Vibrio floridensis]
MTPLSPKLASELAYLPYQFITNRHEKKFIADGFVTKEFSLNKESQAFKGQTGGIFGIGRKTEGFALIGIGKGKRENELVISVRGTKTGHDWMTNLNLGLKGSPNSAIAHSGFVNTFHSLKPQVKRFILSRSKTPSHIHCVGHSLGGALASLFSDWIKIELKVSTTLYTFGAPRVGQISYARKSTETNKNIYRCTHGADPVPLIPLWPFVHAPYNGTEYRLDDGVGVYFSAHGMGSSDTPGYLNTANSENWGALKVRSFDYLSRPTRLKFDDRNQASFTGYWANKLSAALVTLLNDAGPQHARAIELQARISTGMTFYDQLARNIEKIAAASEKLTEQAKGLLGHMLVFAGRGVSKITDLSAHFIRWVFQVTVGKLYSTAKRAVDAIF